LDTTSVAVKPPQENSFGRARRLASVIASRLLFSQKTGVTHEGKRDVYKALGYAQDIQPEQYRARYRRNAIAARIVEAMPKATWRGGGEVREDPNPNRDTLFEKAWDQLVLRLNVWSVMMRADTLGGIGRFSIMLIGAPGSDLSQEMPRGRDQKEIIYLTPFAEDDVKVLAIETNLGSARFGHPTMYGIKRLDPQQLAIKDFYTIDPKVVPIKQPTIEYTKVHHSRVVHLADSILDDQIYGMPRMERVWNLIDDLEKVTGAGAEAFWLRSNPGYQWDLDKDVELEPEEEEALKQEADDWANQYTRIARTKGVKINTLGSEVANFSGPTDAILTQIAGGTGIPKRILLGSERGDLASTQDRSNWTERIMDRRTEFAGPMVVRVFVDRLIKYGYLPTPKEYVVRWPLIQNLDEVQRAEIADKLAAINQKQVQAGLPPVVDSNELRDKYLDMVPMTPQQLADIEAAKPKPALPAATDPNDLPLNPKPAEGEGATS
jgi:hypothetical protein